MSQNHDDIAARLRDEASATAPERLHADVMMRVHAEPRPQRIRPRRSFGRSFATVAAAACILGAMVFGLSRVDFGTSSAGSAGASSAPQKSAEASGAGGVGGGSIAVPSTSAEPKRSLGYGADLGDRQAIIPQKALSLATVPRPLKAAIYGRYRLAAPLRQAFGAIDPHQTAPRP